jgi:hypothetical protein
VTSASFVNQEFRESGPSWHIFPPQLTEGVAEPVATGYGDRATTVGPRDLLFTAVRTAHVDDNVAFSGVHATRGKVVRAEPVAMLYEKGRIRHMGAFTALEDQMCEFTPDLDRSRPKRDPSNPAGAGLAVRSSPDRADALVWAFTEILVEEIPAWGIFEAARRQAEALVKAKDAAIEAGWPKSEPAPGSMEYQALHPEWKPSED